MINLLDKDKKKTIVITGASQGIGQALAYRFAKEGYNIVIAAKNDLIQVQETTDKILELGGQVLACDIDVTDYNQLKNLISNAIAHFGGIDILVNNTSSPCFTDILCTKPEQFDLAFSTSARAAFFLSQIAFPYLNEGSNSHIINIAPPINLEEQWLKEFLPFALGKYGMSLCTLGMAAEFYSAGIAVNSLWPQTNIATPRLEKYLTSQVYAGSRLPSITADAAYLLSLRTCKEASGQFFIDETLLREYGVTDFSCYAVDSTQPLVQTLFLPIKEDMIPINRELFQK